MLLMVTYKQSCV